MNQVKKIKLAIFILTGMSCSYGHMLSAQEMMGNDSLAVDATPSIYPEVWTLQNCISYALQNNINLRKDRISVKSTAIDQLTAKAALFSSLL